MGQTIEKAGMSDNVKNNTEVKKDEKKNLRFNEGRTLSEHAGFISGLSLAGKSDWKLSKRLFYIVKNISTLPPFFSLLLTLPHTMKA